MGGVKKRKSLKRLERRIRGYEATLGRAKTGVTHLKKPGSQSK